MEDEATRPRKKKGKAKKVPRVSVPEGGWNAPKQPPPIDIAPPATKRAPNVDWVDGDFNDMQLVWRFSEIDVRWDHLDNTLDNRSVLTLVDKLRSFESMKMGELFSPGSDHAKKYDVPTVPTHTQNRLIELSRDDEDELVRLRLGGKLRLYGLMRKHVFHVLWWDPHHKVWPSKKKNT